jgi:sigma-B regulation protein RsbU (phosphoserine phosphatase)
MSNPTSVPRPEPKPKAGAAPSAEAFLLEVADVLNTTLDLETLFRRIAEMVRRFIDYDVFAILFLNERTGELRVRFQMGHPPDFAERVRIRVGEGVTGQAALHRQPFLVGDVRREKHFIDSQVGARSELAIPLIIKNRLIGVLDLESREPDRFTADHQRLLTLLASRIAIAIENARLYTRVARQAKNLELLFAISGEITSILNLDELFKSIAERLEQLLDYQMFSILLLDESREKLQHRFSLRFQESIHLKHEIALGRGLVGWAAQHKQAVLVPDVLKDDRYIALNPETRSELCVPLLYKGEAIGVLDLEHTRRGFFTEDHKRTITTLAAQVAIAIVNAQLYEQVATQEQRMERDLAMAHELQINLLPACCPTLQTAEIGVRFAPARAIGGDLYDFIPYSRGRYAIAVGDVSGKGARAALYAALVSGFLRSHATQELGPAEMLSAINTSLVRRPIVAQFVSIAFAVWNDRTRKLHIASSGLPRPIHCRDGKIEIVEATGIPLGLLPDTTYDAFSYAAQPGDVFVIFSDGMVDAANRAGELFGRAGVERVVAENCNRSAEEIADAVFSAVAAHAAGVDPFDDQTVVILKVK